MDLEKKTKQELSRGKTYKHEEQNILKVIKSKFCLMCK